MFGIDCEMCRTVVGIELTRVSVVDEKLNVSKIKIHISYSMIIRIVKFVFIYSFYKISTSLY